MIGAVLLNELLAGRGVALLRSRLQEIFDFGDLDQTERGPDGQLDGDMQAGVGLGSKAQRGGAEAEEGPGDRERGTNDEFDVHKEPA
jgi:hypothetical protein